MRDRRDLPAVLNTMGCIDTGVEVGVYKGQFSNLILSGWPGCLIGVDSYNSGTDFHLMMNAIERNRYFIAEGRYKLIINTSFAAELLVPSDLDFVYLDADHTYRAVKEDISSWYPKVKRGGLFGGHDYDKDNCGVHQAVDEFLRDHPGMELHTKPCGSWFVIKL